jgi:hypothetical protein
VRFRLPRYYGYRIVAAAFVAQFVALGIFSYVLGPFMLPMLDEFGWTRAEFTLSRSIGQVVMGLAGFFIGVQVDRRGARPLMLYSCSRCSRRVRSRHSGSGGLSTACWLRWVVRWSETWWST